MKMNDYTEDDLYEIYDLLIESHVNYEPKNKLLDKTEFMIEKLRQKNCKHEVDKETKACKLCGLPAYSIPCIGGWL